MLTRDAKRSISARVDTALPSLMRKGGVTDTQDCHIGLLAITKVGEKVIRSA
jgi:hypothetical protein